MTDSQSITVNGCTVIARPQGGHSRRWGYEVKSPEGAVLYLSPYRWSSAETAAEAGRKDAEEWEPPAPRKGRPPVADAARVIDVTLPEDLIDRIDAARHAVAEQGRLGVPSRAAVIRDALLRWEWETGLPVGG